MADQDTGCDAADAAGHGGDGLDDGLHRRKVHVAGDAALFLVPVDPDIDHNLVRMRVLLRDTVEPAGSRDQDVRPAGEGPDIPRAGVAVDDGRVLMHEHHGDRAADDEGPADDRDILPADGDPVMMQDLHDRLGGAGREARLCIGEHTCQGQVRAAVDVLGRVEHLPGLFIVQLLWQRPEQQDPVDGVILVDPRQLPVKLLLRHIRRQDDIDHLHTDCLRPLGRAALIGEVIRTLPDAENTDRRRDPLLLERFHIPLHFHSQGIRDLFSL